VVSWTTTIESNMGSSVVVPGRGFPLNNELTDFDATAADGEGNPNANAPQGGKMPRRTALLAAERALLGGKRPRSSMSPTVVLKDGAPPQRTRATRHPLSDATQMANTGPSYASVIGRWTELN
jgi:gamma-glutamyltranspeptidase/glutathione hydrolase